MGHHGRFGKEMDRLAYADQHIAMVLRPTAFDRWA